LNAGDELRVDLTRGTEDGEITVRVSVRGSLAGEEAAKQLRQAVAGTEGRMTIDLSGCDELNSHGTSALAEIATLRRPDPLRLTGAREHVRRELLLAGVRQSELFVLED